MGPEISLISKLKEWSSNEIIVIKVAFGGVNLYSDFSPELPGFMYTRLIDTFNRAMAEISGENIELSGFFWLQGEKDGRRGREIMPQT